MPKNRGWIFEEVKRAVPGSDLPRQLFMMKPKGAMMHILFALAGIAIGAIELGIGGALLGLIVGLLAAEVLSLRKRIKSLEQYAEKEDPAEVGESVENIVFESVAQEEQRTPTKSKPSLEKTDPEYSASSEKNKSRIDKLTGFLDARVKNGSQSLVHFFTEGNLVLKIGVIILFFGFAFLLKYAAQRNLLPIEFRLAGVFVAGLSLLGLGWFLRIKRAGYGLILQGGGAGTLYLVIFAASKLYDLLPTPLSLGVMVGLVALSCTLAVLQNSKSLAVLGIAGGFLAPVLMSSGGGSHVVLFSYFALLNCGILGIAWFTSWRELNLLGFVFTFGIGTLWGSTGYQPVHFATTEPFLILFFLFYVTISILYASNQKIDFKGYVDGPLVFGLPLVATGLQYCLVKDFDFGMAYTALFLGFFYLTLVKVLWHRFDSSMRLLYEAFLSLGVIFASLAIPLAFDGHWSASLWALEGAGMVWVGLKQKRVLARHFGLLLQIGAAVIFLDSVWYPFTAVPFLNNYFLGCVFLSLAPLFSCYWYDSEGSNRKKWEKYYSVPLFLLGLSWWYIGGLREVDRQVVSIDEAAGFLLYCSATSILMGLVCKKIHWRRLHFGLLAQLPFMILVLLVDIVGMYGDNHLFRSWGFVAWFIGFTVQYRLLYHLSSPWPARVQTIYHVVSLWLVVFVLSYEASWLMGKMVGFGSVWSTVCWSIVPVLFLYLILRLSSFSLWPVGARLSNYLAWCGGGLVSALTCWFVWSLCLSGDPVPLTYFPLINPLELMAAICLIIVFTWLRCCCSKEILFSKRGEKWGTITLYAAAFLLLNSVVARSVHVYSGILYKPETLYGSVVFQAALAVLWGGGALTMTVLATRYGNRKIWGVGAVLLAMVVIKLFFVDLAGTGTVARIVSFLVTGILMLIIGYFSPLPPKKLEDQS